MRKNIQKIKNRSLLLQLCVLAVLVIGFSSLSIAPSTFAVSAAIELEIGGIECDLIAIYGNSEPSTVTVPPYCSNQPEFPAISEPMIKMPVTPTFSGLMLESKATQPIMQPQGTGIESHISGGSILIDNGSKLNTTDFVTETLLVAIIAAVSVITALFASSILFSKHSDRD